MFVRTQGVGDIHHVIKLFVYMSFRELLQQARRWTAVETLHMKAGDAVSRPGPASDIHERTRSSQNCETRAFGEPG